MTCHWPLALLLTCVVIKSPGRVSLRFNLCFVMIVMSYVGIRIKMKMPQVLRIRLFIRKPIDRQAKLFYIF